MAALQDGPLFILLAKATDRPQQGSGPRPETYFSVFFVSISESVFRVSAVP